MNKRRFTIKYIVELSVVVIVSVALYFYFGKEEVIETTPVNPKREAVYKPKKESNKIDEQNVFVKTTLTSQKNEKNESLSANRSAIKQIAKRKDSQEKKVMVLHSSKKENVESNSSIKEVTTYNITYPKIQVDEEKILAEVEGKARLQLDKAIVRKIEKEVAGKMSVHLDDEIVHKIEKEVESIDNRNKVQLDEKIIRKIENEVEGKSF